MNGPDMPAMMTVVGPVSVESANEQLAVADTSNICLILLLGATGSGKSAFIECLANGKQLEIAKDQLDGVTQELTAYRIVNVDRAVGGQTIYIVDTPGFADGKFPEAKILRMIHKFMKDYKIRHVKRILYFNPITDTRMTNSRGKTLRIFKAITGMSTERNITIVTTMWDQIMPNGDQARRAEKRLERLQDVYWKDFVDSGSPVCRFRNDHASAIECLRLCMHSYSQDFTRRFVFERMLRDDVTTANTTVGSLLYHNLLERTSHLEQRVRQLEEDRKNIRVGDEDHQVMQHFFATERNNVMAIAETLDQELKLLGRPSSLDWSVTEAETVMDLAQIEQGRLVKRRSIALPKVRNLMRWKPSWKLTSLRRRPAS